MSENDTSPSLDNSTLVNIPSIPETPAPQVDNLEEGISDDTVIISANTTLDGYRLRNFYMTNGLQ